MAKEIGIINGLKNDGDCFGHVSQFGLHVCQLVSFDPRQATEQMAENVIKHARAADVRICAMWGGYTPPIVWNFIEGPATIGLVPPQYRAERVEMLKRWADFASWIGAPAVITHAGFIPENMSDPEYQPVVEAIREIALHCQQLGLEFWFETGQETPIVLLRIIQEIGTGNLGINLDPANLILYGKGNPVDALDVFGPYVRNMHVKDGFYPTDGHHLGREVPVGQGKVNFPALMARLRDFQFDGELIIEREISGEQQERDIRATIQYLQQFL